MSTNTIEFYAERPDPYLSYGEAIEMCKKGIDVASVNWTADEFLTVTSIDSHTFDLDTITCNHPFIEHIRKTDLMWNSAILICA
jgi:hypothetical protein